MPTWSSITFITTTLAALALVAPPAAAVEANALELARQEPGLQIPPVLVREHEHLHRVLGELEQEADPVGPAARSVAAALKDHFQHENEIVMPVLDLLDDLATGAEVDHASRRDAIAKAETLARDLPEMLSEHEAIHAAAVELERAGEQAGHHQAQAFARRLQLHAAHEEQILYPAAIVIAQRLQQQ